MKQRKGRKPGIYVGGNAAVFIFAAVIIAIVVSCAEQM